MRMFRRLSIRQRITIGSTLIAAVILSVAGFGFRAQVESILAGTTVTLLKHDIAPAVEEIESDPTGQINEPGDGQYMVIMDPGGNIVHNTLPKNLSGNLGRLLTVDDEVETVNGSVETFSALSQIVHGAGGDWKVIAVRDNDPARIALERIGLALLVGGGVLLLGIGATAWLLTGASLRPITRMRKQAEALVAAGSSEALVVGDAVDEVSALGKTFNQLIRQLGTSLDRERRLVSDASHEIRTPLAVLLTQLELAHAHVGDPKALEADLEAAHRSAQRLAELANNLLELYDLEAAHPSTSSTSAELSTELRGVVDRVRLLVASRPITVDFELDPEPPAARYPMSGIAFGRVVENLATNAIHAIDTAGVVTITLSTQPDALILTVRDTGPGMPENFIPAAFDRFSRPDEARQRRSGGTGLGLSIVHAIVSSAGGSVTLENDNGLVATVRLPRSP